MSVRYGSRPFTPLSLSPALWLDASDSSTLYDSVSGGSLVAAGGAIARWEDKSGNGRHATQVTLASRPTRQTSVQNGRDVVLFDGSNDQMDITNGGAITNARSGITIIACYKPLSFPIRNSLAIFFSTGTSATNSRCFIAINNTTNFICGGRTLDTDSYAGATGSATSSNALIQSALFDYANTDLYQWKNGAADGSNTSFQSATATSATNSQTARIGNSGVSEWMNANFAEILVFPTALSNTNRRTVERYLAGKYGITIS